MTVVVRPYKRGGWEVDILVMTPSGRRVRERRKAPATSRTEARRWGEARERHLAIHGTTTPPDQVPTLAEFWPRFMEGHCKANRHKPSGMDSKDSAYRNYLQPALGQKRLNAITNEDIARLKSRMSEKQPSTTNNVLSALNTVLKQSVEWSVIDAMPCKIRLLKKQKPLPKFYDFDEYAWLLDAAAKIDRISSADLSVAA